MRLICELRNDGAQKQQRRSTSLSRGNNSHSLPFFPFSGSQVMDEADRLLDMDFGPVIDKLLQAIPRDRTTMLFSATMTTKVAKLQRASLKNPVRVEVGTK